MFEKWEICYLYTYNLYKVVFVVYVKIAKYVYKHEHGQC